MNNNNYLRITPAEAKRLRTIAENYNNAHQPRYNEGVNFIPVLNNRFNDNQLSNIAYNIMKERELGNIPYQDLGEENINPYIYRQVVDNNRMYDMFNQ